MSGSSRNDIQKGYPAATVVAVRTQNEREQEQGQIVREYCPSITF